MFDVGASELAMIAVVSVVVIGPKDMPVAMRTVGRWIGQFRRMSGQFRASLDTLVRQAELDDMEKQWREQNEERARTHSGIQLPVFDEDDLPTAEDHAVGRDSDKPAAAPEPTEPPKPWVNPAVGLDCLST